MTTRGLMGDTFSGFFWSLFWSCYNSYGKNLGGNGWELGDKAGMAKAMPGCIRRALQKVK